MPSVYLTNEERDALTWHLRTYIDHHRWPSSPELWSLKEILGKLDPRDLTADVSGGSRYDQEAGVEHCRRRFERP